MINAFFPAFNTVDSWMSALPLLFRTILWGVAAGGISMLTYGVLSNQTAIASLKKETRELRSKLMDPKTLPTVIPQLLRRNLGLSFSLLGRVLLPVFVSTLPVLVLAAWVDTYHGLAPAGATQEIAVSGWPADLTATVAPESRLGKTGKLLSVLPPQDGEPDLSIQVGGATVYAGNPFSPPTAVVTKKQWWHLLLGSETGYLTADAPFEVMKFGFVHTRLIPYGPAWASGWEFSFFMGVLVMALGLKFSLGLE